MSRFSANFVQSALKGLLRADISAKDPFGADFVCLFDRFHLPFGEELFGRWTSCRTWEAPQHLSEPQWDSATKHPGGRNVSASSPRTF